MQELDSCMQDSSFKQLSKKSQGLFCLHELQDNDGRKTGACREILLLMGKHLSCQEQELNESRS